MRDSLIQSLHFWLGMFSHRIKDPYVAITRAESYLIRLYSTPAMIERGFYLPEQEQAFAILEGLRKQLPPCSRGWVIPKGEFPHE